MRRSLYLTPPPAFNPFPLVPGRPIVPGLSTWMLGSGFSWSGPGGALAVSGVSSVTTPSQLAGAAWELPHQGGQAVMATWHYAVDPANYPADGDGLVLLCGLLSVPDGVTPAFGTHNAKWSACIFGRSAGVGSTSERIVGEDNGSLASPASSAASFEEAEIIQSASITRLQAASIRRKSGGSWEIGSTGTTSVVTTAGHKLVAVLAAGCMTAGRNSDITLSSATLAYMRTR